MPKTPSPTPVATPRKKRRTLKLDDHLGKATIEQKVITFRKNRYVVKNGKTRRGVTEVTKTVNELVGMLTPNEGSTLVIGKMIFTRNEISDLLAKAWDVCYARYRDSTFKFYEFHGVVDIKGPSFELYKVLFCYPGRKNNPSSTSEMNSVSMQLSLNDNRSASRARPGVVSPHTTPTAGDMQPTANIDDDQLSQLLFHIDNCLVGMENGATNLMSLKDHLLKSKDILLQVSQQNADVYNGIKVEQQNGTGRIKNVCKDVEIVPIEGQPQWWKCRNIMEQKDQDYHDGSPVPAARVNIERFDRELAEEQQKLERDHKDKEMSSSTKDVFGESTISANDAKAKGSSKEAASVERSSRKSLEDNHVANSNDATLTKKGTRSSAEQDNGQVMIGPEIDKQLDGDSSDGEYEVVYTRDDNGKIKSASVWL